MAVWSIDCSKRMPEHAQDYTKDLTDEDRKKIIADNKEKMAKQEEQEVISRAVLAERVAKQRALELEERAALVERIKSFKYKPEFIETYREFCKKNKFKPHVERQTEQQYLNVVSVTLSDHLKRNTANFHDILEWIVENTNGKWAVDDVRMSADGETKTFQTIFTFSFEDLSDATYFKLRF